MEPFITVSAMPGAGGRELARAIATELASRGDFGWRVLDEEIARGVARDPRVRVSLDELSRERFKSELEDFIAQFIERCSPQSEVLDRTFRVVRDAARAGHAIIVGRAGVCVTRAMPYGLHLRLVASEESRVERLRAIGVPTEKARIELIRRERWRARLLRKYFQREIDDPLLYDAVLNSDRLSMPRLARIACDLLEERIGRLRQRGTIHL